ncbi:MAG: type II secretion system secretin GspD [Rhodanobacteraceae bacterium]|nr:type II secretion system secretin GspD [Xanthomonadales bacterium]MCP5478478.1 type II secretion system secretin GspD [Rhodanobacteraceae bacterium]
MMRQLRLLLLSLLLVTPALALAQSPAVTPPKVSIPGQTTASGGERHTLNLKDADIGVLIQTVSEITGKSFIVDPSVQGKVTVISSAPISADAIYEVFESVLRVHGFAAVPSGGMVKIVPVQSALSDGGVGATTQSGPDGLVTRVIELQHVSANEVAEWLRPLLPPQAQLLANRDSNSLLVTDRAANVDRLQRIIQRIDRSSGGEVEVIALQHANAAEVASTIATLENSGQQAGALRPDGARIVADARTNSVLLSGAPADRQRLRALIAHLDTPLAGSDNTQVIFLNNANAEDLVEILDGVARALTGDANGDGAKRSATIQAHPETNALVVTAAPAVVRGIESVARQLDVRRAQVLVEAVIVEVADELASEIGVQWQASDIHADGSADGFSPGIIGGTNFPTNAATGAGGIFGTSGDPATAMATSSGLNLGYLGGAVTIPGLNGGEPIFQVGALIRALRGDSRANVLSQPSLVTLDNHEAEFKVVQEVPFLTGQYTNTGTNGGSTPTNPFQTINREDVGLILTVTPHINEGSAVRLDLKQVLSTLAPTVNGAVDLITNKRELSTSVMVPDGGMLVLGGLSSDEARRSDSGVPGLSKIPLLGGLFRSRDHSRSQRQLMVFLRPTILRDAATEAALSSEKYNFLRAEQLRRLNDMGPAGGPLLPELPADLFRNPPPVEASSAETSPLQ